MEDWVVTFWRERHVLVTGCTGLLGSWVARALVERGATVVGLVRDWIPEAELVGSGTVQRMRIVRGELRDQALLERVLGEHEVQTVFHLAAQTIVGIANRNPVSTFETNIAGTWALLEAARRSPMVGQIVVASSDKAYGDQPVLPYTESAPLQGRHPYDVSKSCADLLAQSYAHTYRTPVCITRCGNLYGGGDLNWNRIVPGTIRDALQGRRPVVRSDGHYVRDYFYVEDAVEAMLVLAEQLARRPELAGEAFNFSDGKPCAVLQLVDRILAACGRTDLVPDVKGEAQNEIREQYLDPAKARRLLGWAPRFDLDSGLARTVAWYRKLLSERG